ncbi:MAG: DUF4981 domain-containing protein [Bacteroidetes bacterium]|nr:MAG: DUF4981 domain-containing protein [Bacteroidota bacterium]
MCDRVRSMTLRDRNHASVVFWSLGNEGGIGANTDSMYYLLRQLDGSRRPIHYESFDTRVALKRVMNANPLALVNVARELRKGRPLSGYDINSVMYPTPQSAVRYLSQDSTRPLIICEYAHSMGNSTGNFLSFWEQFYQHPRMQGGFIWDWVDQGLIKYTAEGQSYFAYGGDFGDAPVDTNFCINGVIFPDRRPKPALMEVKYAQQPLWFTQEGGAQSLRIRVSNRYDFLPAAHLLLKWEICAGEKKTESGILRLPQLQPGKDTVITLPFTGLNGVSDEDIWLNITAIQPKQTSWSPAGHEVAWAQLRLRQALPRPEEKPQMRMPVRAEAGNWIFGNEGSEWRIDADSGWITSWRCGGVEQLVKGPRYNLWRASTDNDRGGNPLLRSYAAIWRKKGLDQIEEIPLSVSLLSDSSAVKVRGELRGRGFRMDYETLYVFRSDGSLKVTCSLWRKEDFPLPRVGMQLLLPRMDSLSWFGKGPYETYPDRQAGARVGTYTLAMGELFTPYIRPQESGNRSAVQYARISNSQNRISLRGNGLNISAYPYSLQNLSSALHTSELRETAYTTLLIDGFMAGVGGDLSWLPSVHPEYQLREKAYRFEFVLGANP